VKFCYFWLLLGYANPNWHVPRRENLNIGQNKSNSRPQNGKIMRKRNEWKMAYFLNTSISTRILKHWKVSTSTLSKERDREFIIWQPTKGENDDYDSENSWISWWFPSRRRNLKYNGRRRKKDERPTQRHIMTGDVSSGRTWHRTFCDLEKIKRVQWRKKRRQGWEGGGGIGRDARTGDGWGQDEENWGEGRGEKERGCASRVECDEHETGVEEDCWGGPERVGKEPERLREEGEGRRIEKWGVGRMPSSKRVDVKKGCGSEPFTKDGMHPSRNPNLPGTRNTSTRKMAIWDFWYQFSKLLVLWSTNLGMLGDNWSKIIRMWLPIRSYGKGTGIVIPLTQTQLWEWEGNR